MVYQHPKYAKLNNGEIVAYDNCICAVNKEGFSINLEIWEYIGTGRIYKLDGVLQEGPDNHKFYRKIKK